MRIAIILNNYPKLSEPFIGTFIENINKSSRVYLLTEINKINNNSSGKIVLIPFLKGNGFGNFYKLFIMVKIIFYFNRFLKLYKLNYSIKQLILDAGILTLSKLDYLHFPFANLAFGREDYAQVVGAKMTVSFRGSDLNVYPIYHKLTYTHILQKANKIHCNSIELQNELVNYNFQSFDKVSIITSAIRNDYKLKFNELNSILNSRNYQRERIITIGRLHWVKDYAFALESLALLKKEGFDFEYKIIGNGPELEHLVFLTNKLNLDENVTFMGSLNSLQIKNELQNSTLYIQTSLAEGFSNSCLEAQSQGLLCVVTDVGGMHSCIENGVTGKIIAERKVELMADAIKEIFRMEKDIRQQRELYASDRIFSKFSQEEQKQSWINFFELNV